ncbi:NUDIX domain-containing protein [Streptomyces sp. 4N509B]|uniref:NUDIX domain-containing protein n=1 Tax=Streptomyces sp. 4N509B TaxID=3457413 RepID=UPI003FD0F1BC
MATRMSDEEFFRRLPKATAHACLYLTDEEGRPFQLRSSINPGLWQIPGGHMDPGETPWETAVRECREETGLAVDGPRPLLLTHFVAPRADWPHSRIGLVFDGGILTAATLGRIVLDPAEHSEWQTRCLADWRQGMDGRSWRRLEAIDAARRTGTAGYLETV